MHAKLRRTYDYGNQEVRLACTHFLLHFPVHTYTEAQSIWWYGTLYVLYDVYTGTCTQAHTHTMYTVHTHTIAKS